MATLKLNSYELFTQSENNKPEFGAGVPAGCMLQVAYQSGLYDGQTADQNLYLTKIAYFKKMTLALFFIKLCL